MNELHLESKKIFQFFKLLFKGNGFNENAIIKILEGLKYNTSLSELFLYEDWNLTKKVCNSIVDLFETNFTLKKLKTQNFTKENQLFKKFRLSYYLKRNSFQQDFDNHFHLQFTDHKLKKLENTNFSF